MDIIRRQACDVLRSPVCAGSSWYQASSMGLEDRAPESLPCQGEQSGYVLDGAFRLKSIYSSVPIRITSPDVPNDEIGVVEQFRALVKTKLGKTDDTTLTAAVANSITFTKTGAAFYNVMGVYLLIANVLSDAVAPTVRVRTTGWVDTNSEPIARDITFQPLATAPAWEVFIPNATQNVGANTWSPVLGYVDGTTPSTIIVTGLGTGAGQVSALFCGQNSTAMARVMAAMVHSKPSV